MRDWMMAIAFFCVAGFATLHPTVADTGFQRIDSRDTFLRLVERTPLTRFGIRLQVQADGSITGRALGRDVRGQWNWQDGYFCRTLEYGTQVLDMNCQTVELRGDTLRFTSDRGAGDYADLSMKD